MNHIRLTLCITLTMVLKSGYILPAKNYAARMKALEQGLTNNHIRNLAAIQGQAAAKVVAPSTTTQDGAKVAIPSTTTQATPTPTTPLSISDMTPEVVNTAKISTPADYSLFKLAQSEKNKVEQGIIPRDSALIREVKARLAQEHFGLKPRSPPQPASNELLQAAIPTGPSPPAQQAQEPAKMLTASDSQAPTENSSSLVSDDGVEYKVADAINNFTNASSHAEFTAIVERLKNFKIQDKIGGKRASGQFFKIPISATEFRQLSPGIGDKSILLSWNLLHNNKQLFVEKIQTNLVVGSGLMRIGGGTLVEPYYRRNAPNFGNLFLNEKELKRGNISISQPFSKTYVLHQKNISPLLKKMILDIANTLEFDVQDYHSLGGDEKRIIEKIIRAQRDMREYNISKLIDDDDHKMKKRLQILVGQINAGNDSHLVKEEIRQLLKNLFDNRAISLYKYRQSIKSLDAL